LTGYISMVAQSLANMGAGDEKAAPKKAKRPRP
jgi:hypothetical protein